MPGFSVPAGRPKFGRRSGRAPRRGVAALRHRCDRAARRTEQRFQPIAPSAASAKGRRLCVDVLRVVRRDDDVDGPVARSLDHGDPVVLGAQRRRQAEKVRYSPTSLSLSDRWFDRHARRHVSAVGLGAGDRRRRQRRRDLPRRGSGLIVSRASAPGRAPAGSIRLRAECPAGRATWRTAPHSSRPPAARSRSSVSWQITAPKCARIGQRPAHHQRIGDQAGDRPSGRPRRPRATGRIPSFRCR